MAALTREAYCLDEEKLMELRELLQDGAAGVDAGLEEGFRALRCQAAALQHAERLSSESWDWAENIEDLARRAAETMREEGDDIRRAVSALSLRRPGPGEYNDEAFVEALRKQATLSDDRRADAEELRAATRRLQEKELRRVAAADHHLVDPDMPAFLGYVASHTDSALEAGYVPTAEELAEAAQVEDDALRMEERMARMAVRLRRGAAEFAARPGDGEEALVTALHRQAANADAARATVQAFTASVRRFRAAGSTLRPRPTTGPGTEDDAHENLSSVYLIVVVLIAT